MRRTIALGGLLLSLSLACGPESSLPLPGSGGSRLRPESELVTDCFGFPRSPFTRQNRASVEARLETGDPAVDFTLRDVDGAEVRLSDLLDEPVLLVQGSWTCPRFQEERPGLDDLARKYAGRVSVVLVYNVEAHPGGKTPSPYRGRPWPEAFSDRGQPRTYQERVRNARDVARGSALKVLVDEYDAGRANPIWCTYGTCASCSWLIAPDGTIAAHHEWHDTPSMTRSIDTLLAPR